MEVYLDSPTFTIKKNAVSLFLLRVLDLITLASVLVLGRSIVASQRP